MDTPRRLLLTTVVAVLAVAAAIVAVVLADPVDSSRAQDGPGLEPRPSAGATASSVGTPVTPVWGFARFDGADLATGQVTKVPDAVATGSWRTVAATAGHPVSVSHLDTGRYRVVFPDIAVPDGLGAALATGVTVPGTPMVASCRVADWGSVGSDQWVDVVCRTGGAVAVDAAFTAMFTYVPADYRPRGGQPYAYVRAAAGPGRGGGSDGGGSDNDGPDGAMSRITSAYSVAGPGTVTVRQEGPGRYAVDLGGPAYARAGNNVQVNALGDTSTGCGVYFREALADRQTIHVGCAAGERWTDSEFVLVYGAAHSLLPEGVLPEEAQAFGYAFTGLGAADGPPMRPEIGQTVDAVELFSANSAGGVNTIRRIDVGRYEVTFPGVGRAPDHVQLTPYGDPTVRCVLDRWVSPASGERAGSVTVSFGCVGTSGEPVDAFADVAYVSGLSVPVGPANPSPSGPSASSPSPSRPGASSPSASSPSASATGR